MLLATSSSGAVRKVSRIAVVCLAAGSLLSACNDSSKPAATNGAGEIGGTLVISTPTNPTSVFPPLIGGTLDRQIVDVVYDRLAEIGQDLNTIGDKGFTPSLAERWEWAADSMSIVFHLNPQARWHDGEPVRASDVRFTVALDKEAALGSAVTGAITNVDSVSVRDSLTAVAWFKKRTPEQFYDLVYQVSILPEHRLKGIAAKDLQTSELTHTDLGSGRFRMARYEPGVRVELLADTNNFRGRARLDRVVFSVSPDFNAAVTRFMSGEADMFENLRPEQVRQIGVDTARRTVALPVAAYNYLAMNMRDPKDHKSAHPIFADRAVRVALTMAVDRRAMLKNVFDTIAKLAYGPFPQSSSVSDTTVRQIPYDTVHASALLDSAGWKRGADGIRAKSGRRLAFSISTPNSSAARHSYAVLLQDAFRKVGADVTLDESDFPSYRAKLDSHAFDTEMGSFSTDPSPGGFKESWASSGLVSQNQYSYVNPKTDALLDSAIASFDRNSIRAYSRMAFQQIIDDAPAIWLYEPPTIAGLHKRVHPEKMRADSYLSGLADWWIPATERTARDRIGLRTAP